MASFNQSLRITVGSVERPHLPDRCTAAAASSAAAMKPRLRDVWPSRWIAWAADELRALCREIHCPRAPSAERIPS